jgi:HTH domain
MLKNKKTAPSLFEDIKNAAPSASSKSSPAPSKSSSSPEAREGITSTAFAKRLGVSPATIWRAIEDGRISRGVVRGPKGWRVLDVEAARRDYLEHTARMAARGLEAGGALELDEDADDDVDDDAPNYTRERSLKVRVERQKAELHLAELRGDLVRISSVSAIVYAALSSIRTSALSLADRLAPELAETSDVHAIRMRLRAEVSEMLTASADELERRAILPATTGLEGATG